MVDKDKFPFETLRWLGFVCHHMLVKPLQSRASSWAPLMCPSTAAPTLSTSVACVCACRVLMNDYPLGTFEEVMAPAFDVWRTDTLQVIDKENALISVHSISCLLVGRLSFDHTIGKSILPLVSGRK